MSNIKETRIDFNQFTYKDILKVLPGWHLTSRPSTAIPGDLQLKLNLNGTKFNFSNGLFLNLYNEARSAHLAELKDGTWISEIVVPSVDGVVIKLDLEYPEKSELILEAENYNFSISDGGLKYELTKKDGELILSREFEIKPPSIKTLEGNLMPSTRER